MHGYWGLKCFSINDKYNRKLMVHFLLKWIVTFERKQEIFRNTEIHNRKRYFKINILYTSTVWYLYR